MKERKPNGQFQKGNDIGAETRFKPGNSYVIKSKYKDEYCDAMLSYFMNEEIVFPTFEDFASSIGVLAKTLKVWAEKHARFGDTHDVAPKFRSTGCSSAALPRDLIRR